MNENDYDEKDILNISYAKACVDNNLDEIKELISKGADINIGIGITSKKGYFEAFKYISELTGNIRTENYIVNTSANGHLDVVKYLVEHGANVDVVDKYNDAIMYASRNGHLEIVKYLIEHGADVNAIDGQAIVVASRFGHLDVVKYLIEQGADVDLCLDNASRYGQLEIVKYLVQNGADVNSFHNKAIKYASIMGNLEIVKYLHQNGADLDKAIENADESIKEELINYKTSMEEKALIQNDLKEVKPEQKPKNTMRI